MSKKARLRKKLRRRMLAELRNNPPMKDELNQDFLDLLFYGMVIKKVDADGKETRVYPKIE